MKITHGVFVVGSNSVLLAPFNFMIERANSITAICMPKQMPRYGTLFHAHILRPKFSLGLLCLRNLLEPTHHLHPEVEYSFRSLYFGLEACLENEFLCLPSVTSMLSHRRQESANETRPHLSVNSLT